MKRILIIKTSSLGDVVHCLPVINDIRQHLGEAHIDWVVEQSFAEIPGLHPHVNEVITVAFRQWRKHPFSCKTWQAVSAFKKLIQKNQYDAVIDTQGLLKSAWITRYAHGLKHGYDKHSIREPLASRFYDVQHAISYNQHAVTRNRMLVAASLGYTIPHDAPDYGLTQDKPTQNNAAENRMDIGLQADYIIGLHGTSRDSKLWPTAHWVALARALAQQDMQLALPWGNSAEEQRAQAIASQANNVVILPKLNIQALAEVITHAKAAVGVDTGLSHLAVALDTPTVAIYTDTEPHRTGLMAGKFAKAVNLGGTGKIPTQDQVYQELSNILELS